MQLSVRQATIYRGLKSERVVGTGSSQAVSSPQSCFSMTNQRRTKEKISRLGHRAAATIRLMLTAAVLLQLVLRGFALPEPALAGSTDQAAQPHIHLGGHPHHGSPLHQPAAATPNACGHHHAHHHCHESEDHPSSHRTAEDDGCPVDHEADVVYLDASLVLTPDTSSGHRADDAAAAVVQLPASERSAPACSAGGPLQLLGDSPPDFRGRFPHRLQV